MWCAAQAPLLVAFEPRLLRLWRIRLPHWLALPLSRIAGACRSLKGLGNTALFLALSAAAGGLSLHCLMALRGGDVRCHACSMQVAHKLDRPLKLQG